MLVKNVKSLRQLIFLLSLFQNDLRPQTDTYHSTKILLLRYLTSVIRVASSADLFGLN